MIEVFSNRSASTKWQILKEKEQWKFWFSWTKRETKPPNPKCVQMEARNERTSCAKKRRVRPQPQKLSSLQDWLMRNIKRRDDARNPKCACKNINRIVRRKVYYEDKSSMGRYTSRFFFQEFRIIYPVRRISEDYLRMDAQRIIRNDRVFYSLLQEVQKGHRRHWIWS